MRLHGQQIFEINPVDTTFSLYALSERERIDGFLECSIRQHLSRALYTYLNWVDTIFLPVFIREAANTPS